MEFYLDWLEFWTFLYCVKKRNPYVKIFKKIYFLPVKIKIHTWKNPKICWWKILLPVKSCKILCVKAIFCTWKNSIKGQKYVSRTLLIFTGKKKRCPSQSQVIFSGSEISSIACFCMRYLYLRFSSMMGEHIFYLSGTTRCGARPKIESQMTQIDSQRSKINSKWPKIDFLGKKNRPYNPQTQFSVAQNGLRKIKIHFQRAKSAPSTYTHYTVYGAQYNNKILKCGILMFSCVCSNV